jgi:hypothetical protein
MNQRAQELQLADSLDRGSFASASPSGGRRIVGLRVPNDQIPCGSRRFQHAAHSEDPSTDSTLELNGWTSLSPLPPNRSTRA